MGGERAAVAFREMERYASIDAVCSVGWAGGLNAGMSAASVWHIAQVIDTQTGERFSTAQSLLGSTEWPVLATATRVADAQEKLRLAASYGAALVDMEAATIARLALAKGIPFYCLKAVSDDMDASLPDLNPFVSADGRMRMAPFLAHVAVRPRSWAGLARLGRNSDLAAQHLADAIRAWLGEDFAAKGKG